MAQEPAEVKGRRPRASRRVAAAGPGQSGQLNVVLAPDLLLRLKVYAAREKRSWSSAAAFLIECALDRETVEVPGPAAVAPRSPEDEVAWAEILEARQPSVPPTSPPVDLPLPSPEEALARADRQHRQDLAARLALDPKPPRRYGPGPRAMRQLPRKSRLPSRPS